MVESYPDGTPKSITNYRNGEMAGKHPLLPERRHRDRHAPPKRRNIRYRRALLPKRHAGIRNTLLQPTARCSEKKTAEPL